MEPAGDKTTFFLFFSPSFSSQVPMHRFRVPTHPPLGQVKGGQHDLQLWGESGVAGLGERCEGMAAGFPMPGYNTLPQQPFFLRRAISFQGKNSYSTLWETTWSTSTEKAPSSILWNLTCHAHYNFDVVVQRGKLCLSMLPS